MAHRRGLAVFTWPLHPRLAVKQLMIVSLLATILSTKMLKLKRRIRRKEEQLGTNVSSLDEAVRMTISISMNVRERDTTHCAAVAGCPFLYIRQNVHSCRSCPSVSLARDVTFSSSFRVSHHVFLSLTSCTSSHTDTFTRALGHVLFQVAAFILLFTWLRPRWTDAVSEIYIILPSGATTKMNPSRVCQQQREGKQKKKLTSWQN